MPGYTPAVQRTRPTPTWNAAVWVGIVLLVVGLAALALAFPEADPPSELPGLGAVRRSQTELLVESPAKAHEARNWALFGEWKRNPADEYQFWRAQAPVWVYPLAGVFRLFGVSWTVLHAYSVAWSLIGVAGLVALLRRHVSPGPILTLLVLVATGFYTLHVARSGLVEVALTSAAVWMLVMLDRGREHPGWLVGSQVVFALGFFAKQGMAYLFPVLVVANVLAFLHWRRAGLFPRLRWLPVATAGAVALGAVVLMLDADYIRAVQWNSNHLLGSSEYPSWWSRLDPRRLFWTFWALSPFTGLLGSIGAIGFVVTWVRARRVPWFEALMVAWLFSTWITVALVREWTLRHGFVVVWPSLILVALLMERLRSRKLLWSASAAVVGAALIVNGVQLVGWFRSIDYTVYEVERAVEEHIGPGPAVVVGIRAMPVLLASPYDLFYVKPGFNTHPRELRALGVTHILAGPLPTRYVPRKLKAAGYHYRLPVKWWPLRHERVELREIVFTPPPLAEPDPAEVDDDGEDTGEDPTTRR